MNPSYIVSSQQPVPSDVRQIEDPRAALAAARRLMKDAGGLVVQVCIQEVSAEEEFSPSGDEDGRTVVFHASRSPGDGEWRETFSCERFRAASDVAFDLSAQGSAGMVLSKR